VTILESDGGGGSYGFGTEQRGQGFTGQIVGVERKCKQSSKGEVRL